MLCWCDYRNSFILRIDNGRCVVDGVGSRSDLYRTYRSRNLGNRFSLGHGSAVKSAFVRIAAQIVGRERRERVS